jgi:hypothetical protein
VSLVFVEFRAAKASKREQKARWIFYQKTPTLYQWTTRCLVLMQIEYIHFLFIGYALNAPKSVN